jgi:lipoprotein-releasing system permease protein
MYRLFLALKYLRSRPIHALGMLGVTVGVWALIVVVSIFSGFIKEVRAHVRAASSDVVVFGLDWSASFDAVRQALLDDPNVLDCAPRVVWYGLLHAFGKSAQVSPQVGPLHAAGADSSFVMLIGIDPAREAEVTGFATWLAEVAPGRHVRDARSPFTVAGERPGILLSERRLQLEFVPPGATVRISTARLHGGLQQALDFREHDFTIAGAFSTRHVAFDDTSAFLPIAALCRLLDLGAGTCNEVVVKLRDPALGKETAARLERRLTEALPAAAFDVRVRTWEQRNQAFLSAVDHQRSLMKLVLFVIMVVAAFLMYATLSMMVAEKTHDIGILTALGATRWGVLMLSLACGLTIATLGALLGVLLGSLSAVYLDAFNHWLRASFGIDLFPSSIYNLKRVPYDLDPVWILTVLAMALGCGALVSSLPAFRAAGCDPLRSLRNE